MHRTVPVECEACGNRYSIEITDFVDLRADPLLRQRLMRGALNFAQCPHCGDRGLLDHAFLVLDPVAGRTIFFVPEGRENPDVDVAILGNVLSIFEADDPQPYLENRVQVAEWGDLVTLLAEGTDG